MKKLFENWNKYVNEVHIGGQYIAPQVLKTIEDSGYPENEFEPNQEMPNSSYAMNNGNFVIRDDKGVIMVSYAQDSDRGESQHLLKTLKDTGYREVSARVHDHPDVYAQQLKASGIMKPEEISKEEYQDIRDRARMDRNGFEQNLPGTPEAEADKEILKRSLIVARGVEMTDDPDPRQEPAKLYYLGSAPDTVYAKMTDSSAYYKMSKQQE